MTTLCIVRHCCKTYSSADDVRFHNIPREQHRRVLWLRAIGRDSSDDIGARVGDVCSDHFLSGDYEMNIKVRQGLDLDLEEAIRVSSSTLALLWQKREAI
ncbi:hypothetical protein HPB47_011745 [Ixodes persulcatus]|uniref:Uncharacterized protein n=1 Tax=Ixodes persulcatus TaxID=34615 RepID=A0AC60NVL8_IXOPE|nr:hypothetical protein HPB47_011745 [Ixodes persulcatus]